jgi:hypothetical protein
MEKRGLAVLALSAAGFLWLTTSVDAKNDNLPRMPGATLLIGGPPAELTVTIGDKTLKLQEGGESHLCPLVYQPMGASSPRPAASLETLQHPGLGSLSAPIP